MIRSLRSARNKPLPEKHAFVGFIEEAPVYESRGRVVEFTNPSQDPSDLGQPCSKRSGPGACGPRSIALARARRGEADGVTRNWHEEGALEAECDLLPRGQRTRNGAGQRFRIRTCLPTATDAPAGPPEAARSHRADICASYKQLGVSLLSQPSRSAANAHTEASGAFALSFQTTANAPRSLHGSSPRLTAATQG